jgi:predicted acylesterase/phospholipase RssA
VTPEEADAPLDVLAISAGGDGGAFAAGILTGWSQSGTRPRFAVVTGVSAGAIIAPFAFLGASQDHVLREVIDSMGPDKLFRSRGVIAGLFSDGLASSAPLAQLLQKYVTREMLNEVAREYRGGRELLIMTTDLDAGTPVIWSMGAIAASDDPNALELFREVMLASAAVPGVVSPVLIDVAVGERHFHELHVDGGVVHQVFLPAAGPGAHLRHYRAFIIMNMRLTMERTPTPRRTLRISSRAIDTMIATEARNDVEHISADLRPAGAELQLAYIDGDFRCPHPRDFDARYMHALFTHGLQLAMDGRIWHERLPHDAPRAPQGATPTTVATLNTVEESGDIAAAQR